MVSSVSTIPGFNAATYLSQLKSNSKLTGITAVPTTTAQPQADATDTTTPTSSSTSSASNLLGLSPDVLSLLQGTSSSSDNLVSNLLGGASSSSDITSSLLGSGSSNDLVSNLLGGSTGVLAGLLAQDSSTLPTTQALQSQAASQSQSTANTSPVQSLINSYNDRLNANNANLLQGAQDLLTAGQSLLA